jgi:hypothetical protein
LDAGRSSTDDAHGDISPSTYRGGINSTDRERIGEEINFITSPPYILAWNLFRAGGAVLERHEESVALYNYGGNIPWFGD